jgi:hypothetical protein
MASNKGVIFPDSMADIIANPIDIFFGSMPAKSTTLAPYLVIESNVVASNQHAGTDL